MKGFVAVGALLAVLGCAKPGPPARSTVAVSSATASGAPVARCPKRATGEGPHRVGVVVGHGSIELSEANLVPPSVGTQTLEGILLENFRQFALERVDLREPVDETLEGLWVLQPSSDLSEAELRRIDKFATSCHSVAFVVSAVNVATGDATFTASISTHGLERLLSGYGITIEPAVVLEFGRPFRVPLAVGGQKEPIYARFPPLLDVRADERFSGDETLLDSQAALFRRVENVTFAFASPLTLHPEAQLDVPKSAFRVIARSTPKAMTEAGVTVDLRPLRQCRPKGKFRQFALAATVEGPLRGALDPTMRSPKSRIAVISSSQFFANPFARAGNATRDEVLQELAQPYAADSLTGMILVAKNLLDWTVAPLDP